MSEYEVPNNAPEPVLLDSTGSRILAREVWPRSDWKVLVKAQQLCNARSVGVAIMCAKCSAQLLPAGMDAAGSVLVECDCTSRVWEAR